MGQMSFGDNGSGRTRADQIFDRFAIFHRANLHFYELFCRFADRVAQMRDHYSARAIFHRVRWEVDVELHSEDSLKLNNDYSPYYARMYLATHPGVGDFFQLRKRKSADKRAYKEDIAMHHTGPAVDEEELMAKLKELADEDSG